MCQTLLISYSLSILPTFFINWTPTLLWATKPSKNTSQPSQDLATLSMTPKQKCAGIVGKRICFSSYRHHFIPFLSVCNLDVTPEEQQPIHNLLGNRLDAKSQHGMDGEEITIAWVLDGITELLCQPWTPYQWIYYWEMVDFLHVYAIWIFCYLHLHALLMSLMGLFCKRWKPNPKSWIAFSIK